MVQYGSSPLTWDSDKTPEFGGSTVFEPYLSKMAEAVCADRL